MVLRIPRARATMRVRIRERTKTSKRMHLLIPLLTLN